MQSCEDQLVSAALQDAGCVRPWCAWSRVGGEARACSGGPDLDPTPARRRQPQHPLTLPLTPDITGPIILQTYRAIASYEKNSRSEMTLATGDVVDVVEKNENGQPPRRPAWTSLPNHQPPPRLCPRPGSPSILPAWPSDGLWLLWGPWQSWPHGKLPSLESVPQAAVGVCTHLACDCALDPGGPVNLSSRCV